VDSKLTQLTDDELLNALSFHPSAPSVRFHVDGGVRMVHAGRSNADDVRRNAKNEHRDLREGPGFVAGVFYDHVGECDACIVART
jgi:hypothetical protein